MKKHAITARRAAAEPFFVWRMSDRPQTENLERPARRRPRRHDDPFREPDGDDPRGSRHGPSRYDRRSSRNQLRSWEVGWKEETEDDGPELN